MPQQRQTLVARRRKMDAHPILEKFSGIAGVSTSRLDQLLTLLCQIYEESAAHRTAPRGDIDPSESDDSQRLGAALIDGKT